MIVFWTMLWHLSLFHINNLPFNNELFFLHAGSLEVFIPSLIFTRNICQVYDANPIGLQDYVTSLD